MSDDERPRLTDKGELALRLIEQRDVRRKSVLFNDITRTPGVVFLPFSERMALCDYLWEQGWRRDVRPEDVTPS